MFIRESLSLKKIKILYPRIEDDIKKRNECSENLRKILAKSKLKKKNYFGHEDEIRLLISGLQDPLKGLRLANHTASFDLDANLTKNFLRADPVHLRADKNRVYLFDYTSFELKRDEALEIVSKLNRFFESDGIKFHVGVSPYRWYAEGIDSFPIDLPSPSMMNGLPLETSISNMFGYKKLKTVISEIQMILFDLSLNNSRVKSGSLPINSLWFWGGGDLAFKFKKNTVVVTDCDVIHACCRAPSVQLVDFDSIDFGELCFEGASGDLYVGFSTFANQKKIVRRIQFLDLLIEKFSKDLPILIEIISNRHIFLIDFFTKFRFWKSDKVFKNSALDDNLLK